MTKDDKAFEFEWATCRLNYVKNVMAESVERLRAVELYKEAEKLEKMIYQVEAFQNKYNNKYKL